MAKFQTRYRATKDRIPEEGEFLFTGEGEMYVNINGDDVIPMHSVHTVADLSALNALTSLSRSMKRLYRVGNEIYRWNNTYTGTISDWTLLNPSTGVDGADGKSAYEIAVDEGFLGTETEWLASLKGDTGDTGAAGSAGQNGTNGADGKSAYEIAVDDGFSGTETEWLASLKGEPGSNGAIDDEIVSDATTWSSDKISSELLNVTGTAGADGKSAYEIAVENGFSGTEAEWLVLLKGETGRNAVYYGRHTPDPLEYPIWVRPIDHLSSTDYSASWGSSDQTNPPIWIANNGGQSRPGDLIIWTGLRDPDVQPPTGENIIAWESLTDEIIEGLQSQMVAAGWLENTSQSGGVFGTRGTWSWMRIRGGKRIGTVSHSHGTGNIMTLPEVKATGYKSEIVYAITTSNDCRGVGIPDAVAYGERIYTKVAAVRHEAEEGEIIPAVQIELPMNNAWWVTAVEIVVNEPTYRVSVWDQTEWLPLKGQTDSLPRVIKIRSVPLNRGLKSASPIRLFLTLDKPAPANARLQFWRYSKDTRDGRHRAAEFRPIDLFDAPANYHSVTSNCHSRGCDGHRTESGTNRHIGKAGSVPH